VSFSYAATCMDEDSAGGDLGEQLSSCIFFKKMFSALQWSIALLS